MTEDCKIAGAIAEFLVVKFGELVGFANESRFLS